MESFGASLKNTLVTIQAWRIPKLYRQPLDRSWLISLGVAPLLVVGIGYVTLGPPSSVDTSTDASTDDVSLLSISRRGNDITVTGDFPDASVKATLLNAVKSALPPTGNIIDRTHINPNAKVLDFARAETVFAAGAPISDFKLTADGDIVTFTGTAVSKDQRDTVERAATVAWPHMNIVDKVEVKDSAPSSGAASCAGLQSAIGPIAFENDGVSLTADSGQALTQLAERLKACPNARVTVNGYTDNTGSEAINVPLSTQRAQVVADFLVARGVAGDHVIATGLGSANPIAPNDTPEGRAKNRRAEIVVS